TRYWRDWSSDVCSSDLKSFSICSRLRPKEGSKSATRRDRVTESGRPAGMNRVRLKKEQWRVGEIIHRLEKSFPDAETELKHESPWQLLAATILSAQCTDARVNQVTPGLFRRYPAPLDMSKADREELEGIIRSTGFYKSKANSLIGCAKEIVGRFGGRVPEKMEELTTLPGVGRKTANVVLGSAFKKPAVVVDTHVRRVAN